MEQSAKPGEIYLTTTTQSLAANRVETEALDPVSVKGISEPVPVFSLRRVRSVEEAVLDTTRTSFVGRRAELNHFRGMLDICIEEGHGQTIYVRGEPGIGKTRLVEEFTTIAAGNGASTHRGLVLPFGVGKGQNAIRSLVRNLLGIAPGGGKDARLLVAQTALSDGRLDPDWAVFLNDLLDLPQSIDQKSLYVAMDNTTRNEGKRAVVSALLSIASKNQPTVVIIEDVHWADALILAHLSTLTQTVADCSALLVMTSRIEGDQLDQSWRSTTGGSPFVAIDLGPLRKQDSIALIGEFIDTSDTLVASCLERAAGNPLFLEQLLRNAQEGTTDTLPDSIQSLVLARIDRLQTGDKKALQAASVIGQRFHPDALSHLLGLDGYNCGELVEHSLVRSEGGEYLFAHALIQESVYGSMLKGRRRELHGKAAEWFTDSDLTLRAQHLDYAGDDRAPGAYLDAAREQEKQSRFEHAIALTKQGLTIASDSNRFELRFLQGKLQLGIGATPESIDTYRKALAEANSDTERCRASIGVAEGLRVAGEYETMQEELASAEVIAMRHELSAELARIRLLQGNAAFFLGDPEAGFVVSTRALDEARAAGSLELEARALSNLGDAEYGRGHMLSAHGFFSRCVKISRECGFGQILPGNLGMLGVVSFFKNDFRTFEDNLRSSIELAKKTRQLRKEMIFSGFLGGNMMEWSKEGALTEAQKLLARQDELALDLGAKDHLAVNRVRRARISLQAGDVSDAESLCHEAIGMYREIGSRTRMSMAFSTLAEATRDTITRRSALKEGEALLPGALGDTYLYFYRDAIEACLRTGEWDEVHHYIQALENYTRVEPLPWSNFFIARGRALAAYGRGEHGDASIQELHRLRDEAKRVRLEVAVRENPLNDLKSVRPLSAIETTGRRAIANWRDRRVMAESTHSLVEFERPLSDISPCVATQILLCCIDILKPQEVTHSLHVSGTVYT